MAGNETLQRARWTKHDEFYTLRRDVEDEVLRYAGAFRGKSVFCSCNDSADSGFVQCLAANFERLGLRRLAAVSLAGQDGPACRIVVNGNVVLGEDGGPDMEATLRREGNERTPLEGGGEYRSEESLRMLQECDIVCTNPPFGLFRDFMALLLESGKKFLVMGSMSAAAYKEVFPSIKEGKIWLGCASNRTMAFRVPEGRRRDERLTARMNDGRSYAKVPAIAWFTNMKPDVPPEHPPLVRRLRDGEYPRFDNYRAVSVGRVKDIPIDCGDVMGVPVTYLCRHDPEQFEIVGCTESEGRGLSNGLWDEAGGVLQPMLGGRRVYKRIFIRNRRPEPPC